jgi:hypothetical protein
MQMSRTPVLNETQQQQFSKGVHIVRLKNGNWPFQRLKHLRLAQVIFNRAGEMKKVRCIGIQVCMYGTINFSLIGKSTRR